MSRASPASQASSPARRAALQRSRGCSRWQVQLLPEDEYDLTPATWSDLDERLVGPGIAWGAAKAMEHKRRHGAST